MSQHPHFVAACDAAGVTIRVKVVPGARADAVAGVLGDRLKIRVAAPPEDGRANAAVEALVARALGIPARRVRVQSGHGHPEKLIRIDGLPAAALAAL